MAATRRVPLGDRRPCALDAGGADGQRQLIDAHAGPRRNHARGKRIEAQLIAEGGLVDGDQLSPARSGLSAGADFHHHVGEVAAAGRGEERVERSADRLLGAGKGGLALKLAGGRAAGGWARAALGITGAAAARDGAEIYAKAREQRHRHALGQALAQAARRSRWPG